MSKNYSITIGEYRASQQPAIIRTLLGSCVAVCIYDREKRIGGMNHILLPGKADMKHFNKSARYGCNAMELLIKRVINLGGRKKGLTAKIFGGANVLPKIDQSLAVGGKNVSFVKDFLKSASIRIIKEDTGGTDTRIIYFHTDTGDVFLKRTPSSMAASPPPVLSQKKHVKRKFTCHLSTSADSQKDKFFPKITRSQSAQRCRSDFLQRH